MKLFSKTPSASDVLIEQHAEQLRLLREIRSTLSELLRRTERKTTNAPKIVEQQP